MSINFFGLRSKERLFEDFIIEKQQELYKLAYSYVKNQSDAMDIIQESILKAYSNLSKLKDVNTMEKWIKRIVINTAIDFIRKNSKVLVVENKELIAVSSEENMDKDLRYVIDDLDEDLKTIIILKYFHGYSINEVAEILEIPISKVKNRMHKALKLLRVEFKEGC